VRNSQDQGIPHLQVQPFFAPGHQGSQHFALLPTDVKVSPSGSASFLSYVNNIHPENVSLLSGLQSVLTKTIPLFEHVLTDLHRSNPLRQRIEGVCQYIVWDEPESPDHSDDEEGWAAWERDVRHWTLHRPLQLPEVPIGGYPGGLEKRRHRVSLCGRQLQLIINISETQLVCSFLFLPKTFDLMPDTH
jgi:hypothetical protein